MLVLTIFVFVALCLLEQTDGAVRRQAGRQTDRAQFFLCLNLTNVQQWKQTEAKTCRGYIVEVSVGLWRELF